MPLFIGVPGAGLGMMTMLIELIGWGGSFAILLAYALLSAGRITAGSLSYQLMNIGGAAGMAINGWAHGALPSVFNNLVWLLIGVAALGRLSMRFRQQTP